MGHFVWRLNGWLVAWAWWMRRCSWRSRGELEGHCTALHRWIDWFPIVGLLPGRSLAQGIPPKQAHKPPQPRFAARRYCAGNYKPEMPAVDELDPGTFYLVGGWGTRFYGFPFLVYFQPQVQPPCTLSPVGPALPTTRRCALQPTLSNPPWRRWRLMRATAASTLASRRRSERLAGQPHRAGQGQHSLTHQGSLAPAPSQRHQTTAQAGHPAP